MFLVVVLDDQLFCLEVLDRLVVAQLCAHEVTSLLLSFVCLQMRQHSRRWARFCKCRDKLFECLDWAPLVTLLLTQTKFFAQNRITPWRKKAVTGPHDLHYRSHDLHYRSHDLHYRPHDLHYQCQISYNCFPKNSMQTKKGTEALPILKINKRLSTVFSLDVCFSFTLAPRQ